MTDKIACVDFDGVIHPYHGWVGCCKIAMHPPIKGIYDALLALRNSGYKIYIFSARDAAQIMHWLKKNDKQNGKQLIKLVDGITNIKPPATVFFDDRAVHVPPNTPDGLLRATNNYLLAQWETH